MKTLKTLLLPAVFLLSFASCYKAYDNPVKPPEEPVPPTQVSSKYNSMKEFHAANQVKLQSMAVNGSNGGAFTTQQGTEIMISPNTFVTLAGGPVTGNVSLEFKEIYKKSDMILSAKPTIQSDGRPLKSAGEFFLKATYNGEAVQIAPGKSIVVQPNAFGLPPDPGMEAFTAQWNPFSWVPANTAGSLDSSFTQLYINQFLSPEDSGTWYNCDNGSLFAAYQQTTLTLEESDDPAFYGTEVFLVFADINSVIQISYAGGNSFNYNFAPVGFSCVAVALGVKNGVIYSSVVPITIGTNQTVPFIMSPVSEELLKGQLLLLD